jgi:hypothetical protein
VVPAIGRNASAKSIGVEKRIEPPQSDNTKQLKIATDGMEMTIVVVMKNMLSDVFMPDKNMWCAQTMKDMNARNTVE